MKVLAMIPFVRFRPMVCPRHDFPVFRYYCHESGVPLGKFVIPNPFGPFEEPRFTAYLMRNWREGKPAEVKTPDYLRDNIHVDLLAAVYARFVQRVSELKAGCVKINPSGYVQKQGEFAQRVAQKPGPGSAGRVN